VDISRRLIAESVGTAFLLAAIVGSGIMAVKLSGGNEGLALLCNSTATGAIPVVLIRCSDKCRALTFNHRTPQLS
jgi:glycerol uptake facilitator-like aquaporin